MFFVGVINELYSLYRTEILTPKHSTRHNLDNGHYPLGYEQVLVTGIRILILIELPVVGI